MKITSINNFNSLNFKRSVNEHKSWGAQVEPKNKNVSFKIFTYPDADSVDLTVYKSDNPEKRQTYNLINRGKGIFETETPLLSSEVKPGDKYFYTILRNGSKTSVKDPYSFKQDEIFDDSVVYDQSEYKWHDDYWFSNSRNRISRLANKDNGLMSLQSAVIYEMHVGTSGREGRFESAKNELKRVKELGFNAIEIMPVEATNSFNWGYDGVDKFSPSGFLGGPDGLKSFIDYAHNLELNVIIDMVPNHVGPEGNQLAKTGPYISSDPNRPFGEKFNYEGADSEYVRDFMVNAALNWLHNYHCDGLRLDLTSDMGSDKTMKQIAAEVNYHKPDAFLIAEDGRMADSRITNPLRNDETGKLSESEHNRAVENIFTDNSGENLQNLGFDSRWDFDFYHTLRSCLNKNLNLNSIEHSSYLSEKNIKYLMSHDEIGNHEGTRLMSKLIAEELDLFDKIILNDDDKKRIALLENKGMKTSEAINRVKGQKTQLASEKLVLLISSTPAGKLDENLIKTKTNFADIKREDAIKAYSNAFKKSKMAMAKIYSIPGPKMIFQGDEVLSQTPFRFFRKFKKEYPELWLHDEKGYDTGEKAYKESNLILNKKEDPDYSPYYETLIRDLNKINADNPALKEGNFIKNNTVKDYKNGILGMHTKSKNGENEIFAVTNFKDTDFNSYGIKLPYGTWREILNTDDKKYGGSGNYMNDKLMPDLLNNEKTTIAIPSYSTIIFKRV